MQFSGAQEAKDFVVTELMQQAEISKVKLSERDQQLLDDSEDPSTIPELLTLNAKIVPLMRAARATADKDSRRAEAWREALEVLAREGNYLSDLAERTDAKPRPPWDLLKLWGTGLVIVIVFTAIIFLTQKL